MTAWFSSSSALRGLTEGQHTTDHYPKDFKSRQWKGIDVDTSRSWEVSVLANSACQAISHQSLAWKSEDDDDDNIIVELYQTGSDHTTGWVWDILTRAGFEERLSDKSLEEFPIGTISTSIMSLSEACDNVGFIGDSYSADSNNCQKFAKEVVESYGESYPDIGTTDDLVEAMATIAQVIPSPARDVFNHDPREMRRDQAKDALGYVHTKSSLGDDA